MALCHDLSCHGLFLQHVCVLPTLLCSQVGITANQWPMKLHNQVVVNLQSDRLVVKPALGSMTGFLESAHLLFQSFVRFIGQMDILNRHDTHLSIWKSGWGSNPQSPDLQSGASPSGSRSIKRSEK